MLYPTLNPYVINETACDWTSWSGVKALDVHRRHALTEDLGGSLSVFTFIQRCLAEDQDHFLIHRPSVRHQVVLILKQRR
jgi:hypothetical protein